jgi:hypothetical protein
MTSFQPATESQTGHTGARQTRVEDAALLRGLGCDADDAAIPPGTLHAAIRFAGAVAGAVYKAALAKFTSHGPPVTGQVRLHSVKNSN